jgi:hypothetical protein
MFWGGGYPPDISVIPEYAVAICFAHHTESLDECVIS